MRQALKLAESALQQGEFPIAALVVLNGRVISSAITAEKRKGRFLVHAELYALLRADKLQPFPGRRRDATLYSNLEPCLMCLGAAMSFFIGKICYALESPSDGAVALVSGWQRPGDDFQAYRVPQIEGGILREESVRLFRKYVDANPPGGMRQWAQSLAELG
jgi:tRNA(adenine34) deaminase